MDYIYVIDGGTNVIEDSKMIIYKRQRGIRYHVKYNLFVAFTFNLQNGHLNQPLIKNWKWRIWLKDERLEYCLCMKLGPNPLQKNIVTSKCKTYLYFDTIDISSNMNILLTNIRLTFIIGQLLYFICINKYKNN